MKRILALSVVAVAVLCTGCAGDGESKKAQPNSACTLTTQDLSFVISVDELQAAVDRQARRAQTMKAGDNKLPSEQALNARAVQQSVADALWLAIAKDADMKITASDLDAEMQRIQRDQFIDDTVLMQQIIQLQGYTEQTYREHAKAQLAFKKVHPDDDTVRLLADGLAGSCDIDEDAYAIAQADRDAVYKARPIL